MSVKLDGKLVTMANQIATAFDGQRGDAIAETAAHILAFWPRPMRDEIIRYHQQGGDGLSRTAQAAVAQMASELAPAGRV